MCACAHEGGGGRENAPVHLSEGSEDNLQESVLSFYHMRSRD